MTATKDSRQYKGQNPFRQFGPSQKRIDFSVNRAGGHSKKRKVFNLSQINNSAFIYYSRLQKVKEYVEIHHSEDVSLQTVAKVASLERKYFSAFFHRKIGITYTRWLTSVRIAKAMALIRAGDDSLTHIAAKVGFEDLRTFERAFKKFTSLTPLEFKKSSRPS